MMRFTPAAVPLMLAFALPAQAAEAEATQMRLTKSEDRASVPGPAANFTGRVWVDPLFTSPVPPQRATGAYVTFEPGARSAWHTHPLGQTLVVTSGTGWVQAWGGEKKTLRAGDVVHCPPGVKHWHGATDKTGMVHLAIQEATPEGEAVTWLEKVSDAQYTQ
ncbi:(R)-mandelonitrile lyase [Chimaeribacter arupi]|uniref:(R)-mandelonitrile lyase n=1 Tax=Chimaeribacter arupi TaxID=2060066 RepID=UPI00294824D9|nr:cupin domain-containing protein [Chimaeribacter arupi]MDV5140318.1 cupin domain-containing protein [Chimaeribacter arupi]